MEYRKRLEQKEEESNMGPVRTKTKVRKDLLSLSICLIVPLRLLYYII